MLHLSLSGGLRLLLVALLAALALRIALTSAGVWARLEAHLEALTTRAWRVAVGATFPLTLRLLRLLPRGLRWQVADRLSAGFSGGMGRVRADMQRIYAFLDTRVFPPVIKYFTHPLHIAALLVLGVGLLSYHDPIFELVAGNYTNIGSCLVAVILLYRDRQQETKQDARDAAHQQTAEAVARLHERHDVHAGALAALRDDLSRIERLLTIGSEHPETPAS